MAAMHHDKMKSHHHHHHHHHAMGYSRARMDSTRPGAQPVSRKAPD
jgi:hypothetical protein